MDYQDYYFDATRSVQMPGLQVEVAEGKAVMNLMKQRQPMGIDGFAETHINLAGL